MAASETNRLTFKQAADLLGVDPSRVSQMVKEGKLTVLTDDAGVRYLDGLTVQREYRENTDHAKAIGPRVRDGKLAAVGDTSPATAPAEGEGEEFTVPKLNDSKARLEYFKAQTAEVEYRKKVGELVEVETVRREAFESARALREAILSVPDRLAAELTAETDPNRVHSRLTEELTIALEAVAARQPVEVEGHDDHGDLPEGIDAEGE